MLIIILVYVVVAVLVAVVRAAKAPGYYENVVAESLMLGSIWPCYLVYVLVYICGIWLRNYLDGE